MAEKIAPLTYTAVEDIPKIASSLKSTFFSHKTKPLEYRKVQLRKLYWALKDNAELIAAACMKDLNKGTFETYLCETGWCYNDCIYVLEHLDKWAKDEKVADVPLMHQFMAPRIKKDPIGNVLIIGTYNFPIQLTIGPLIGAIAAGCTAVLKPSEVAPTAAAVVQKIVEEALDPASYAIVQGAVPETTALLDLAWDKIFYTGGTAVAKIISRRAAEHLTPVVLELGGRNPAIVTKNADIRLAARRLAWGKTLNAGQVCVSQNYTMIEESCVPAFVAAMKATLAEFYPNGAQNSADYGRIASDRAFQRLKKMLSETGGKILLGGTMDEKTRFLEPTVVQVNSEQDPLLADESFGPLIVILPVKDLDNAIRIANSVSDTSLGLYAFGNKADTKRILNETRSGGATINDAFYHASVPQLPFGGVGESGQGAYRGKASFDVFTHRRTIAHTPNWIDAMLAVRYPPFAGTSKLKQFSIMSDVKPNFDRAGRENFSLIGFILKLGGR